MSLMLPVSELTAQLTAAYSDIHSYFYSDSAVVQVTHMVGHP